MGFFDELITVSAGNGVYGRQSDDAHWLVECSTCGNRSMLAVAIGDVPAEYRTYGTSSDRAAWLMCPVCGMGAFAVGQQYDPEAVYPRPLPFSTPEHLSEELKKTWIEALRSFSASAFTSCALMCRKIIFHLAVEAGLPAKNERNFAPRFEECVDHLVKEDHITARHRDQWVDSIRKWGNVATHDLAPIDEKVAHSALEFTRHLLLQVYTFPRDAVENSGE